MDKDLWDSIPSNRAKKYPGKHGTYVFGQSSADGTACIACAWQTYSIHSGIDAVMAHDSDRGVQHKHSDWAPTRDGKCPCGKEEWPSDPVDIVSESVREYVGDGEGADEEVLYKYNLSIAEKIIEGVIRENCSFRQLPDRIRYHAVEGMTSYE